MHPVIFHLRNKLTWMSRQLRSINKAADVVDWASAMHSIYNLLVDVSGNAELLQDSSPARNHLTKVTKSEKSYQMINRNKEPTTTGQTRETNIELINPKKQMRLIVKGKRLLHDHVTGSNLPIAIHQRAALNNELVCDDKSARDMNIEMDDDEDRLARSLPLTSPATTRSTVNSIPAHDLSRDDNKDNSEEPMIRAEESAQRNNGYSESKQLLQGNIFGMVLAHKIRNDAFGHFINFPALMNMRFYKSTNRKIRSQLKG